MDAAVTKPAVTISVRELVEFMLRTGDLSADRGFVGSRRMWEGVQGHLRIQKSRPEGYSAEVAVRWVVSLPEFDLVVRGRLDGLWTRPEGVMVEEIKTVRSTWRGEADPLHWAQARVYAAIIAQQRDLHRLTIQLTYLELDTNQIISFQEIGARADLDLFLADLVEGYLEWARRQQEWNATRASSLQTLVFPHPTYRAGQREMAVAVFRRLREGGRLFIEAPTGIGKTVSALFPALKFMAEGAVDHLFYLTAKTSGQIVVHKALQDLRRQGLRLRAVTLTASEKLCQRDGQPCDRAACPRTIGYYDRLKPALKEALDEGTLDRDVTLAVAARHQLCPFEFTLDLSSFADLIIGDFNYVFDPTAYLRRFFQEEGGSHVLLIDESHNLVDRGREMFSAGLWVYDLEAASQAIVKAAPKCAKALQRIVRSISGCALGEGKPRKLDALPADLDSNVRLALEQAEAWLVLNQSAPFRDQLLQTFFDLHAFLRVADAMNGNHAICLNQTERGPHLNLFCLHPGPSLRESLDRCHAAIFFSATLSPLPYFQELLGGAVSDFALRLTSPFPQENLCVLVHDRIATTYRARASSLSEVAAAIEAFVRARVGHYLIFLPSHAYLEALRQVFADLATPFRLLAQTPGMSEVQRGEFLGAFENPRPDETLVGFAVMGGIFGEGVDLVGERLVGAVVVGVGLPQLSLERDLIRERFQDGEHNGFEYAYVFPGVNRVRQAAGRVIRTEQDRGAILLIDQRWREPRFLDLLPSHWNLKTVQNMEGIHKALRAFW